MGSLSCSYSDGRLESHSGSFDATVNRAEGEFRSLFIRYRLLSCVWKVLCTYTENVNRGHK